MTRRDLLRLAGLSSLAIFAPRFGPWYRRGSGLMVRDCSIVLRDEECWTITTGTENPQPLTLSVNGTIVPTVMRYDRAMQPGIYSFSPPRNGCSVIQSPGLLLLGAPHA